MKRNRIFQELVLFVIIAFVFTSVGFFAVEVSYAHQLCSGCPTEDSGETYCYSCNTEHNHLEEAKNALDSEISSANGLITSIESLKHEVENSGYSDSVVSSIASGLGYTALSLIGAVGTAVSLQVGLASAGTAAPAAYVAATSSLMYSSYNAGRALDSYQQAWDTYKYHNAEVPCPEPLCGQPTTQAGVRWNGCWYVSCVYHLSLSRRLQWKHYKLPCGISELQRRMSECDKPL